MPQKNLGRSLLIVDDDLCYAESLADMLGMRGYTSHPAATPEEALALLREPPEGAVAPAVALIDVRLGGIASGVDLLPRLRAEWPDLICVLVTTDLDSETAITALRRGAYDYFDKSCDLATLLAVLDRCFDRVALQRDRELAYEALRRAKEEAEAANRGKSSFLAAMSHELRTPLNAIIGFSEMMMQQVLGPLHNEQYRTYVTDIHESGTHLLQIINDILDLSKAEAGKLELFEEVFDLHDTIQAVLQLVRSGIAEGGLYETMELPADLPRLRADERKTKQVLLNLVTNAIKFTPAGGQIVVSGRADPETGLVLTVTDTGIGIAAEDFDRVLEPFEQVDSSLARAHQGTGLGLPLVKAIMELHGGSLQLASEVGLGTRVSVTFPASRMVGGPANGKSRNAA
jgi:signal transduction histidine kinase